MPNKPTDKKFNITTALGADVSGQLEESFEIVLTELNSKLQFLINAEIIDCEDADEYKCTAFHLAIDFLLDKENEETEQDSCCNK